MKGLARHGREHGSSTSETEAADLRGVRVTTWLIEVRDPGDAAARAAVRAYVAELDELLGASSPTIADPDPALTPRTFSSCSTTARFSGARVYGSSTSRPTDRLPR